MTIRALKLLISDINDDFTVEIEVEKEIPDYLLKGSVYPYPTDTERCQVKSYDIGWSDKKIKINVEIKNL